MTSEVVVQNKRGLVLAADSAVTTSGMALGHPRYSKTANKIFDACPEGRIAVMIFENVSIDKVPWELAVKEFRASQQGKGPLPTLQGYVDALLAFIQSSALLFPQDHIDATRDRALQSAVIHVLSRANDLFPDFSDESKSLPDRLTAWTNAVQALMPEYAAKGLYSTLSQAAHDALLMNIAAEVAKIQPDLSTTKYGAVIANPTVLMELAIAALYKEPTEFLGFTGVVVAGYGDGDLFPGYKTLHVYGHVGSELVYAVPHHMGNDYCGRPVTYQNAGWIQAFAQSTMIDLFTDGFGYSLRNIIRKQSGLALDEFVAGLQAAGVQIPAGVATSIHNATLTKFMGAWIRENYDVNFMPLINVIGGLSVQEMADLAENLLTLESLKERVTSPTESVGGPIDIAVITRSEGLVWVKRKHFFDQALNLRYVSRVGKH